MINLHLEGIIKLIIIVYNFSITIIDMFSVLKLRLCI
jgi:hypothetical protein